MSPRSARAAVIGIHGRRRLTIPIATRAPAAPNNRRLDIPTDEIKAQIVALLETGGIMGRHVDEIMVLIDKAVAERNAGADAAEELFAKLGLDLDLDLHPHHIPGTRGSIWPLVALMALIVGMFAIFG